MKPSIRIAAVLLLALALAPVAPAGAQEETVSAPLVQAKIAALDLDAAKGGLARLRADAKTAGDKAAVKELEREYGIARKLEPLAKKQVPQLVAQGKARDAYALVLGAIDANPGAAALPALFSTVRPGRNQAFLVLDDFDEGPEPAEPPAAGTPAPAPPTGKARVGTSKGELVNDAMGGAALRWTWDALAPGDHATAGWDRAEGDTIDLAEFESVSLRLRLVKGSFSKPLYFSAASSRETTQRGRCEVAIAAGAGWQTIKIPLQKLENRGAFDPVHVASFYFSSFAPGPVELLIDEVLLARKVPK